MPIELAPEEFFETVGEPDASGFTAPPGADSEGPRPEPAPAYHTPETHYADPDPRVDVLQQTVNALLTRPQPAPAYYPPPQPQAPQEQGWKARDFFTPDDARLLLTSQDPAAALNRSYNAVAQQVYDSLTQELSKRDAILIGMHNKQEAYRQDYERRARAQQNQQVFYSLYPDMRDPNIAPLVQFEAASIARESQYNPAAYVNRSDQDIYNILAQRVHARLEAVRNGGTEQPSYTPPAPQRTFMERGSGARQGGGAPADSNTRALREMDRFKRQGR